MTLFIRLLDIPIDRKAEALREATTNGGSLVWRINVAEFREVPRSPFAYWVRPSIRQAFARMPRFEGRGRGGSIGASTKDDFRYVRTYWEVSPHNTSSTRAETHSKFWTLFVKGGQFSPVYSDPHLSLNWRNDGRELKADISEYRGSRGWGYQWSAALNGHEHYFRPGLTWPRRTTSGFGIRVMPAGCIFADKGPAAVVDSNSPDDLMTLLSLTTSAPFRYFIELQLAAADAAARSYEVGVVQRTPVPDVVSADEDTLAALARRAWSLKRTLDTIHEISHAFILPAALRSRLGAFDPPLIHRELADIQRVIDDIAFRLYGIEGEERIEIERWAIKGQTSASGANLGEGDTDGAEVDEDEEDDSATDDRDALLSWCVGVAFGRFDIRLATGERTAPPEPEPFDPLPTKSPGMVPEDQPPRVLLVDDPGHAEDLTAQVRAVLARVEQPEPEDLRRWLARDFFPLHLKMYSKSRRKAPIYWQLATPSASYSVWLYLHAMSRDILYTVQNEHVAAKLAHEERRLESLRREISPSPRAAERKQLAAQEAFVEELRGLLDEVKRVAPLWNPDLDDGVIINFAPLWRLVPHQKAWQKDLKATWDALCAGEYDWAHLAMHLWPERVVPRCASDRSLAIAHGLEDTFWMEGKDGKWMPRPAPVRPIGELVHARISSAVKEALKSLEVAPAPNGGAKRGRKGKSDA